MSGPTYFTFHIFRVMSETIISNSVRTQAVSPLLVETLLINSLDTISDPSSSGSQVAPHALLSPRMLALPSVFYYPIPEGEIHEYVWHHHALAPPSANLPQPRTSPQHLHILSTTLIFSVRPKSGSSKSTTSSRKPSRILDPAGRQVSAYVRSRATERSSRPDVSGEMVLSASWSGR